MITLFIHGFKKNISITIEKKKILYNWFTYLPCGSTDQQTNYEYFS